MILLAIVLVTAGVSFGQNDDNIKATIDSIFAQPDDSFINQYDIVSSTTQGSFGAIDKCGEGQNQGVNVCVPYYNCDGETKTVLVDGSTDGFGIIDIRFGSGSCDHYLDTCCNIPETGLPPNFNATQPPPTVPPPTVPPPTPPTDRPTRPPIHGGGDGVFPTPPPTKPTVPPINNKGNHCGIRNEHGIDFQITGNLHGEAEYGEFPWMVAILKKHYNPTVDPSLSICGGSLLTPNVVLTGAHCVHGYKTSDIKIRAGEWDTQTTKERLPYQERDVLEIIIRKDFNSKVLFNDVALLILNSPLIAADNLGTICLPPQNTKINSKHCFASGWGKTTFGQKGQYSVILKKIELPTVSFHSCEQALRQTRLGNRFHLHESFMCAGGLEGIDACTGDGGSPLVCPDPTNPNRYIQAGLVAWGIGCGGGGVPGVYADIGKFRQWIDEELKRRHIPIEPYII